MEIKLGCTYCNGIGGQSQLMESCRARHKTWAVVLLVRSQKLSWPWAVVVVRFLVMVKCSAVFCQTLH